MAKLIPAAERVIRARQFIQQAREFPIPPELGKNDLSYIAGSQGLVASGTRHGQIHPADGRRFCRDEGRC